MLNFTVNVNSVIQVRLINLSVFMLKKKQFTKHTRKILPPRPGLLCARAGGRGGARAPAEGQMHARSCCLRTLQWARGFTCTGR